VPLQPKSDGYATGVRGSLAKARIREYLRFDSVLVRKLFALGALALGSLWWRTSRRLKAFNLLCTVHRGNYDSRVDRVIERMVKTALEHGGPSDQDVRRLHVEQLAPVALTARNFQNPERLIGTRILVVKAATPDEKGIIILDYSFVFPLVAQRCDLQALTKRYHLVLEPSWSGFCDPDILCYANLEEPVFVQSAEPRDTAALRTLARNLIPVPIAANWWADQRLAHPLPGVQKDVDVIMVSSWAWMKRHHRVFHALAQLARSGRPLRTVLVGYPTELTKDDIYRQAVAYGLRRQIEMYESLSPAGVNEQFNRAKVNVLWSRGEGFNRSIIEGFLADVPCIMRVGFNYGHPHAYINPRTGLFASEAALPSAILDTIDNPSRFAPRAWALENMSCQIATRILGDTIARVATARGERWTRDPVVKVGHLRAMGYWDENDRARFSADYDYLRSLLSSTLAKAV
jgi:glycosyltransferase involved in cell wall biosynthesis